MMAALFYVAWGMIENGHQSVLLEQAVQALRIRDDGAYLDCTYGRGGHSAAILDRLGKEGRLFAIDKDPQAIDDALKRFSAEPRFAIWPGSFAQIGTAMAAFGWTYGLQGVLMDLGVSSPQLDQAERGFSFRFDGPLDMRMDTRSGVTAADWLAAAELEEITRVLKEYGEERFAYRIATRIVETREETPFERTEQLAELVAQVVRTREPGKHPATRTFQALRIVVNGELEDLKQGLAAACAALAPGGRLVVISFHSLEDRIVKRFIRDESTAPAGNRRLPPEQVSKLLKLKRCGGAVRPEKTEQQDNPRARSAIMRVAEKIAA